MTKKREGSPLSCSLSYSTRGIRTKKERRSGCWQVGKSADADMDLDLTGFPQPQESRQPAVSSEMPVRDLLGGWGWGAVMGGNKTTANLHSYTFTLIQTPDTEQKGFRCWKAK